MRAGVLIKEESIVPIVIALLVIFYTLTFTSVVATAGAPGPELEASTNVIVARYDDWPALPPAHAWHIGATGGESETVTIAAGETFHTIRVEAEVGFRRGGTDRKCTTKRKGHYSREKTTCRSFRNDDVWTVTIGAYPTVKVASRLSLYAGGGLGLMVDGNADGVGRIVAGFEIEVYRGVSIDTGYRALWGFNGNESHGVFAGLRYRF